MLDGDTCFGKKLKEVMGTGSDNQVEGKQPLGGHLSKNWKEMSE